MPLTKARLVPDHVPARLLSMNELERMVRGIRGEWLRIRANRREFGTPRRGSQSPFSKTPIISPPPVRRWGMEGETRRAELR